MRTGRMGRMPKKERGVSPMDAALSYLTAKPRTVREMELYLDSQNYGEYEVYSVVERLKELNYLNDEQYAADFVRSRLATKPISRRKLREQLCRHNLPKEITDAALAEVDDATECQNARLTAEKYYRQFACLEEYERKCRVMKRLFARGYDFALIRSAVEEVLGNVEGLDTLEPEADEGEE